MAHSVCSSRCDSFLDCPAPTFFYFASPSPSLFQHLCWVHARASDKALCVPSFGSLPRFSSWLLAPPSWKPHNCLPFSCTPQSLCNPAGPLKDPQTHPGPDRNTPKLHDPHFLKIKKRDGEAVSVCEAPGGRWRRSQGEQPLHNAISHFAALGHEIKRGIHCRSLKSFL